MFFHSKGSTKEGARCLMLHDWIEKVSQKPYEEKRDAMLCMVLKYYLIYFYFYMIIFPLIRRKSSSLIK